MKYHIIREDGSEFETESDSDLQFLRESHPEWEIEVVVAEATKTTKPRRKKADE